MNNPLSAFEDFQQGKPYKYIGSGCAYLFLPDGTISLKHLEKDCSTCEIFLTDEEYIIIKKSPLTLAGIIHCNKCGLTGFISQDLWITGIKYE